MIEPFTTPMDVVWMLGPTRNNDWELRYSMRSFYTHYQAESQAWIIGRIPSWIDQSLVNCIPFPNPYPHKDGNLLNCALRLALEPGLSDPFILCSDDHFLLRDSAPEDFKWWHNGKINPKHANAKNSWRRQVGRTHTTLASRGYTTFEFEGHIPYPLKKEWLQNVLRFNFGAGANTLFTTILNCAGVPAARLDSQRIRGRIHSLKLTEAQVRQKWTENQFGTLNNGTERHPAVRAIFKNRFSEPAPWELDQKTDTYDIHQHQPNIYGPADDSEGSDS